jgi:hypothetical protein
MAQEKIKSSQLDLYLLEDSLAEVLKRKEYNWISLLDAGSDSEGWGESGSLNYGGGIALSRLGNPIVGSSWGLEVLEQSYYYKTLITKLNLRGDVVWKKAWGHETSLVNVSLDSVGIDSAGNIYFSALGVDASIVRCDSNGEIQWQRALTFSGAAPQVAGMHISSNDDLYVCGYYIDVTNYGYIAKYNSSGVIQWQRALGGANIQFYNATVDSNDNVYVVGRSDNDALIAKYNSSGIIQWQRELTGVSTESFRDVTVDAADNVYAVGSTFSQGAGGYDLLIAKYNSSGVIQWQRTLGGANTENAGEVVVDSLNNVYICGQTNSTGAGGYDGVIAKYNSSGVIQWQKTLGQTNSDNVTNIAIGDGGCVYGCGYSSLSGSVTSALIFAIPSDGSLDGTYGSLVYAPSTLTDQASTLTDQASTLTDQAGPLTDQAGSLVEYAVDVSSTVYFM